MATHEDDQSISDILNASYDSVESGAAAPEGEQLEIDETPDAAATATPAAADGTETVTPAADPADPAAAADAADPLSGEGEGAAAKPDEAAALDPQDHAPSSWKPEIAQKWAEVPAEVREEIQRRETDYHKGIEQYKQYAGIGRDIEKVVTPHMQTFSALGVHPMQAIDALLKADHTLRFGTPEQKTAYFGQIAQEYGIDIGQVKPPAPVDPAVLALQQQNQQLQQFQQSVLEQQNQAAASEIERFKADPANMHYEAVRDDMALLLQSGKAESLQDAYDKAVWMRPDIRKSLVEQQRTEAEQKARTQARDKRAQSAAVGIKGSAPSKGGSISPKATLRETISAAMDGDV